MSRRGQPVRELLGWYERHKRDLPWRHARDPYRVWVSEIMLQQTRVETVIPYYERFLERYPDVAALPGIGEYTAAAIAGIAFDLPHAVLDGNVMRLLTRVDGDRRDIAKSSTRKSLQAEAQALMESAEAGERGAFNQALMELGSTVCTPRNPKCLICPWMKRCRGFG